MSDQDLFTDDLAESLKSRAKTAYQPSNGTEGDMFMARWCDQCTKDSEETPCEILSRSFVFDIKDLEYPGEWQYGSDGQPKCTAFQRKFL